MLNYCDVGIAPSTFVKNIYSDHNILRNKWIIIPPWIYPLLFPFHLSSTLKNTLLFVGPLIPAKGIDLLIDALLIVERKIPFLTLHICGPGQEITSADKKRIDQKIVALHSTSVIFLGMKPLSELAKEYYTATISITCPLWPEVFGQTWAQSLSC